MDTKRFVIGTVFGGALSYGALITLAIGDQPSGIGVAAGMGIGAVVAFCSRP